MDFSKKSVGNPEESDKNSGFCADMMLVGFGVLIVMASGSANRAIYLTPCSNFGRNE